MAILTPTPVFDDVTQLETTDYVLAGAGGISNQQAQELANRTEYLRNLLNQLAAQLIPPVSGAVLSGRVDTLTGLDILLTSHPTLHLVLNAAPSYPCVLAFQNGLDTNGLEKVGYKRLTANINLNNTPGIAATYLAYAQLVGSTVFLESTYRNVSCQPIPPSVVDGLWFDYNANQWYEAQGASWVAVTIVPLGTFTWNGSNVTSVRNFPYGVPYFDRRTQAGEYKMHAANETPLGGYLLCDGSAVSRVNYPRLYSRIGTTYGVGNGSTTFNLPDLRGEFMRGFDNGRGVDTNTVALAGVTTNGSASITGITNVLGQTGGTTALLAVGMAVTGTGIPAGATITAITSSTAITISANATASGSRTLTFTGRVLGQWQGDQFRSHFHNLKKNNLSAGSGAGFFAMDDAGVDGSENTELIGGTETRPRNVAVVAYIKY